MNQPKDHHYLPVFYLKRWAGPGGKVWRYYRPWQQVVASECSPRSTAYKEGLYRLDGLSNPEIIETKFFSVVDSHAAPVLERMLREGPATLGGNERQRWTVFLMSMLSRSPRALVEIKSVVNGFFKVNVEELNQSSYAASRKPGDPESVYDFVMQQAPVLADAYKGVLPDMINNSVVGEHIMNMRWAVLDLSRAPHTLLTADRPCMTSNGMANPKCILSLPVSPTHLFVAANDVTLLHQLAAQSARDTARNSNNCVVKLADENVYGCNDAQIAFVEKRLRKHGEPGIPGVILRGGARFPPSA